MDGIRLFAFADEAGDSIEAQIDAMKRNSLQGLEIRNVDCRNVSELTREEASEIRKKLDGAGLITWSIGSPIGKIDIEKDDFAAHLEKYRRVIETAHILGTPNIRIFSFYIPAGKDPYAYRNEVIDRLGKMADIADSEQVVLCYENEKGIYGDNADRTKDILDADSRIKYVFDAANFIQCGQETNYAWDLLKGYVKYVHIKDATEEGIVVPAGKGVGNLERVVSEYLEAGGREFTVEPHLSVFGGLTDLEKENKRTKSGKYFFKDQGEAFDTACSTLREILKKYA